LARSESGGAPAWVGGGSEDLFAFVANWLNMGSLLRKGSKDAAIIGYIVAATSSDWLCTLPTEMMRPTGIARWSQLTIRSSSEPSQWTRAMDDLTPRTHDYEAYDNKFTGTIRCRRPGNLWRSSRDAQVGFPMSAAKEMQNEQHHGKDRKDMNQPTRYVKTNPAVYPSNH
jgi:hypothetical protein